MRFLLLSWLVVVGLQCVLVACQQDLPLWSGPTLQKELYRPYLYDASSAESPDYDVNQKSPFPTRQSSSNIKKRVAAMGVDLPDYILHYRGKSPDLGSFRERMQISGRR